jgi:hypothetical protein
MLNLYVMCITNPTRDPLYNFTLMKMTDKEIHHILRFKNCKKCDKLLYTFYIILQALSGHSE